jgi:ubiquinone/menaquinone biosynthesis C-methylase UbiE
MTYVLGNEPEELARLDRQAALIEVATGLLLQAAGIAPGMRVLDLGTGLGHVARLVAGLVGPHGRVVGIDQSGAALDAARRRTSDADSKIISFVEADVTAWISEEPFDAIVGRLVLFHVADPVAVVRHHLRNLARDGRFVAVDFDIGSSRTEPPTALASDALRWIMEAFTEGGASPRIGARLATILEEAGLETVSSYGIQAYLQPHDPAGAALLAGVVRSLAPVIVARGIATPEQMQLETLPNRIAEEMKHANAVMLPPTVAGAWGRPRQG